MYVESDAGWSSLAARRAHNPKVTGSNPVPATNKLRSLKIRTIDRCECLLNGQSPDGPNITLKGYVWVAEG
jgi:hypothetical protein